VYVGDILTMDFGHSRSPSHVTSTSRDTLQDDDEQALKWAALERLPTYNRARKGLLHGVAGDFKEIDLQKLRIQERKELLDRLISNADKNEEFLKKLKKRIDRWETFSLVYVHFSLTLTSLIFI
jgi:predicted transcriptional regulator